MSTLCINSFTISCAFGLFPGFGNDQSKKIDAFLNALFNECLVDGSCVAYNHNF